VLSFFCHSGLSFWICVVILLYFLWHFGLGNAKQMLKHESQFGKCEKHDKQTAKDYKNTTNMTKERTNKLHKMTFWTFWVGSGSNRPRRMRKRQTK